MECWDIRRGELVWGVAGDESNETNEAHQGMVRCVAAVGDWGAATVGWDGAIRVWHLGSGECVVEKRAAHGQLRDGATRIMSVACDDVGRILATSGQDDEVRLWDCLLYTSPSPRDS